MRVSRSSATSGATEGSTTKMWCMFWWTLGLRLRVKLSALTSSFLKGTVHQTSRFFFFPFFSSSSFFLGWSSRVCFWNMDPASQFCRDLFQGRVRLFLFPPKASQDWKDGLETGLGTCRRDSTAESPPRSGRQNPMYRILWLVACFIWSGKWVCHTVMLVPTTRPTMSKLFRHTAIRVLPDPSLGERSKEFTRFVFNNKSRGTFNFLIFGSHSHWFLAGSCCVPNERSAGLLLFRPWRRTLQNRQLE